MSSGEADAVSIYTVNVDSTSGINEPTFTTNTTTTWGWGNNSWPNSWWYTNTIYLYQLLCPKPRCKTYNWCELDKTVACKKCGSLLKAVSSKADYEIPVK